MLEQWPTVCMYVARAGTCGDGHARAHVAFPVLIFICISWHHGCSNQLLRTYILATITSQGLNACINLAPVSGNATDDHAAVFEYSSTRVPLGAGTHCKQNIDCAAGLPQAAWGIQWGSICHGARRGADDANPVRVRPIAGTVRKYKFRIPACSSLTMIVVNRRLEYFEHLFLGPQKRALASGR